MIFTLAWDMPLFVPFVGEGPLMLVGAAPLSGTLITKFSDAKLNTCPFWKRQPFEIWLNQAPCIAPQAGENSWRFFNVPPPQSYTSWSGNTGLIVLSFNHLVHVIVMFVETLLKIARVAGIVSSGIFAGNQTSIILWINAKGRRIHLVTIRCHNTSNFGCPGSCNDRAMANSVPSWL